MYDLCFFYFFCSKSFLVKNYFLTAEIDLTTRGPLYTCLVMHFLFIPQSAVGYEHQEKLQQHESQKDYSKGFGGKFGVQTDRKDEVSVIVDILTEIKCSMQYLKLQ